MALSIVCSKTVFFFVFLFIVCYCPRCLWGLLFYGCFVLQLVCQSYVDWYFLVMLLTFWFSCCITGQLFLWVGYSFLRWIGTQVDLKRFMPVHELFHKTTEQQNILMFFYRLTFCDICHAFYGTGKKLADKVMWRMPKSFNNYVSNWTALNL